MATVNLWTYKDAIDHALDFLGADVQEAAQRDARRAILNAYRDLANRHRWSYFYQRGRLATVAHQNTGTVEYTHTGGTYERQLVITGNTWPTWAAFGVVAIGNVAYEVAERKDSTTLTLTATSNPGADVASGTSYLLYRDTFPLPIDCLSTDEMINASHLLGMTYHHPRAWLARQRILQSPAAPAIYTIRGDPNYMGQMAVTFFPPPDQAYQIDFLYQRRPRQLLTSEYSTGSVAVAEGGTTVTGTGTAWTSQMVGSVIRFSADGTNIPTGLVGARPAYFERVVSAVGSATSLTIDSGADATLTASKYILSDPIDVEEGAMLTAFWRCLEWQLALSVKGKDRAACEKEFDRALVEAREADSRSFKPRAAGDVPRYPYRLKDMPSGPDVS